MPKYHPGWAAIFCAGATLSTTTMIASYRKGEILSQAVCIGVAAAFGGLAGWSVYHRISRRNDGLLIFGLSAVISLDLVPMPCGSIVIASLIISGAFGCVSGLMIRFMQRARPEKGEEL